VGERDGDPVALQARLETGRRLAASATVGDSGTAKLVYDAMVKVADRTTDANKLLETKANGVIALSSALLGFGINMANAQHVVHVGIAVFAIVSLLLAIAGALRANLTATFDLPSPAYYNVASIVSDPRNEGRIALEIAEAWHRYTTDERLVIEKNAWLNGSVIFMAFGVLAFAGVAIDVLLATRAVTRLAPNVVH
jgi:hypothetical protein